MNNRLFCLVMLSVMLTGSINSQVFEEIDGVIAVEAG
jgi:hypothetical protein